MLCSIPLCVNAATTYKKFDSVFVIGDSNTMGYGLKGYKNYDTREYLHGLKGSFSTYVADKLNIATENRNLMAYPGLRSKDALYYLGGSVDMTGDKFFKKYSQESWDKGLIVDNGKDGTNFMNQLKYKKGDNKLVIVATGPSDIFYSTAQETIYNSSYPSKLLAAAAYTSKMQSNYAEFQKYFPKLIEYIRQLNPSATILVLGYYNPVKNLKLTDLSLTSEFDALDTVSENMNKDLKTWAKNYGCTFVDITNAETFTQEKGLTAIDLFKDGNGKIYHLNSDGHKYVARQILQKLKATPDKVTSNMTIDLGAAQSVSKVTIDGKEIKDFTYNPNNHFLKITYSTKTAKSMTVTQELKDGGTYVGSYELIWDDDCGYIAHCKSMTESKSGSLGFLQRLIDFFFGENGIFNFKYHFKFGK